MLTCVSAAAADGPSLPASGSAPPRCDASAAETSRSPAINTRTVKRYVINDIHVRVHYDYLNAAKYYLCANQHMYSTIHERSLVLVIANMYNTTARLPVVNAHARRHYLVALLLLGQQSLLCVVEHALCARQLLA